MQTLHVHTLCRLCAHLVSDRSSLQTDLLHTKNQMQLSMHKVYICTLGADKYADFMHTLWDRLKKCASSLQMHTLCRLYMQTVCRPEMISKKVCKKSAYAHLMQTFDTYCADFVHTIEFFSSWFLADIVLEQWKCHTHWPQLVQLIKTLGKDLDWKFMHT